MTTFTRKPLHLIYILLCLSLSLTIGCADQQFEESPHGLEEKSIYGSSSGNNLVHIRFAGFIPCSAVNVPGIREFPYIGGDDRSFGFDAAGNRSRASASLLIDPDQGVIAKSRFVGKTRAYKDYQVQTGSGLCNRVHGGEAPSSAVQASAEEIKYSFEQFRISQGDAFNYDKITLVLEARNPISYAAPALNAWVTVLVGYEERGGVLRPVSYKYTGAHDGFPSYELYVNREFAFGYDIIENGANPFELFFMPDKPFESEIRPIRQY